jgi:hypothetical protein
MGQASAVEVGDQALFMGHPLQRRRSIGFGKFFQQWPRAADGFFDLPEGVAAMELRVPTSERRI